MPWHFTLHSKRQGHLETPTGFGTKVSGSPILSPFKEFGYTFYTRKTQDTPQTEKLHGFTIQKKSTNSLEMNAFQDSDGLNWPPKLPPSLASAAQIEGAWLGIRASTSPI